MKNNLAQLRKAKNLTQQDMADAVKEKVATYRTWERGTTNFNIAQLVECARVLDCSTDEILGVEVETEFTDSREAELHRVWIGAESAPESRNASDSLMLRQLHKAYDRLNDLGKQEAVKRVTELSELPRYTESGEKEAGTGTCA